MDMTPPYGVATYKVEKGDIDQYGHVNYKAYPRVFEPGQDQYMDERGVGFAKIEEGYGLRSFVKAFSITYEGQLFQDQQAEIRTRIDRLGRTSINYKQQLFVNNNRIALMQMTVVLVDEFDKPAEIPDVLRQKLEPENLQ